MKTVWYVFTKSKQFQPRFNCQRFHCSLFMFMLFFFGWECHGSHGAANLLYRAENNVEVVLMGRRSICIFLASQILFRFCHSLPNFVCFVPFCHDLSRLSQQAKMHTNHFMVVTHRACRRTGVMPR